MSAFTTAQAVWQVLPGLAMGHVRSTTIGLEIFARHVLIKESDNTGVDDVQLAVFAFVKAMHDLDLKRWMDV